MTKDIFSRYTRIMLAVLLWGVAVTSCTNISGNTVNDDDDADHPSKGEKTIWVLSDIHVMAPELFQGTDKAEEVRRSSKLLQYSAEILDRVVDSALSTTTDKAACSADTY